MTDKVEQLAKLNELKEKGIISEKEFEKSKQDILNAFSFENTSPLDKSKKSRTVALLLCLFLGEFGAHRFYAGYNGLGILYFFTLGLLGIGALVDFIFIICGTYKDSQGKPLTNW